VLGLGWWHLLSQQRITFVAGRILDTGGNKHRWCATAVFTRFLLLVLRAVPEPIWALIFYLFCFRDSTRSDRACSPQPRHHGASDAEVTENLDERPLRALRGCQWFPSFPHGVLPCTLPVFLLTSSTAGKSALSNSDCGFVGAGGLAHGAVE